MDIVGRGRLLWLSLVWRRIALGLFRAFSHGMVGLCGVRCFRGPFGLCGAFGFGLFGFGLYGAPGLGGAVPLRGVTISPPQRLVSLPGLARLYGAVWPCGVVWLRGAVGLCELAGL